VAELVAFAIVFAVVLALASVGPRLKWLVLWAVMVFFFAALAWWLHSIWVASPLLFCTLLIIYAMSRIEQRK
jgi:hypothetical protein